MSDIEEKVEVQEERENERTENISFVSLWRHVSLVFPRTAGEHPLLLTLLALCLSLHSLLFGEHISGRESRKRAESVMGAVARHVIYASSVISARLKAKMKRRW